MIPGSLMCTGFFKEYTGKTRNTSSNTHSKISWNGADIDDILREMFVYLRKVILRKISCTYF